MASSWLGHSEEKLAFSYICTGQTLCCWWIAKSLRKRINWVSGDGDFPHTHPNSNRRRGFSIQSMSDALTWAVTNPPLSHPLFQAKLSVPVNASSDPGVKGPCNDPSLIQGTKCSCSLSFPPPQLLFHILQQSVSQGASVLLMRGAATPVRLPEKLGNSWKSERGEKNYFLISDF